MALGLVIPGQAETRIRTGAGPRAIVWNSLNILRPNYTEIGGREQLFLPVGAPGQGFKGDSSSWEELFSEAVEFATDLGPDRVLNISHSTDHHQAVVVVWYWTEEAVTPSE